MPHLSQVNLRSFLLLGGLMAVMLLVGPAAAQDTANLHVEILGGEPTLESGTSWTHDILVRNDGYADGQVELSLQHTGDGWDATLDQRTMTLEAGEEQRIPLTLTAPDDRNGTAPNQQGTVEATITDATGMFTSTDEDDFAATLTPAPQPELEASFPWVPIASGVFLVAGVAGTAGWAYNRRETGVTIEHPQKVPIHPGQEIHVPLTVVNENERPRTATVDIDGDDTEFRSGLNLSRVSLEPYEKRDLWLFLRAKNDVQPGAHEVHVRAKPIEARRYRAGSTIRLEVRSLEAEEGSAPEVPGGSAE